MIIITINIFNTSFLVSNSQLNGTYLCSLPFSRECHTSSFSYLSLTRKCEFRLLKWRFYSTFTVLQIQCALEEGPIGTYSALVAVKGKGAAAWDTPVDDFDYIAEITSVSPLTGGYGGQFNRINNPRS